MANEGWHFYFSSDEFISLEVVVPVEYAGDFIVKFGENFTRAYMNRKVKEVDSYFSRLKGWHVIMSIDKEQEDKLYVFIRNFSKEKNLSFTGAEEP